MPTWVKVRSTGCLKTYTADIILTFKSHYRNRTFILTNLFLKVFRILIPRHIYIYNFLVLVIWCNQHYDYKIIQGHWIYHNEMGIGEAAVARVCALWCVDSRACESRRRFVYSGMCLCCYAFICPNDMTWRRRRVNCSEVLGCGSKCVCMGMCKNLWILTWCYCVFKFCILKFT